MAPYIMTQPHKMISFAGLAIGTVSLALAAPLQGVFWGSSPVSAQSSRVAQANNALAPELQGKPVVVENYQLAATQGELSRYREAIALLRQPNNRLLTLKGMAPTSQSSGSLVIAPQGQAAVLTLQNVSSPPPGKVYRMWAYMGDREVSCAEFMPNAEGKVFLKLPLDQWAETSTVVVTIEPVGEMPEPTGEKVMEGWRSL